MAERYQVRGRRIWDSETDTYSGLYAREQDAINAVEQKTAVYNIFKKLESWQEYEKENKPYYIYAVVNLEKNTWKYHVHHRSRVGICSIVSTHNDKEDALRECDKLNGEFFGNEPESDPVEQPASDPVDHPAHYTQGSIECIDAIASALGHDAFIQFLRGQVIKYMWRLGHKGDALEDAKKGTWYASRLVAELAK
jgi:Protein of unknwon function (DUF3310)